MKNELKQENIPFEKALERLEEVVEQLEKGETSLEGSIELFNEGMKLVNSCSQKLEWAEQQVDMLIEENGQWVKKPLSVGEEFDD